MTILATLPNPNLFSTLPSTPPSNHPPPPPPKPPIPIPKYPPPLKSQTPPTPKPTSNPAFKTFHHRSKYYKPVREGVISSDGDRSVVVGDSGVSYLLPGAPFEFQYSYSETPKSKPLAIREPAFLPFAPPTMPRPWTGKAPLKKEKKEKKIRLFDSLEPLPMGMNGVKHLEMAKPYRLGDFPVELKPRKEVIGKPLTKAEIRELLRPHISSNRQVNLGRDGLTHNMLELVHTHWKRRPVCKVRCLGVPTVDMDNVCRCLEEKTGGKIIHRVGGIVYLFRGRNYDHRTRPQYPVMLWKPAAPVYPKLIQEAPEGLTKVEADQLRKKGKNLQPICKLAKNGVYTSLVRDVRNAFEGTTSSMDPCPFVRLIIESLALKLPLSTKPAGSGVYPATTPCYCTLRFKNFPSQTALLPLSAAAATDTSPPSSAASSAGFHLDSATVRCLSGKPLTLRVSVYTGRMGRTCGVTCGKLIGRVRVSINLEGAESRVAVFQNGWMKLGSEPDKPTARLHMTVRAEPDPRFVFQFGGEPECSPVVFQIQGNIRQPVFSCKFSADRNARSRSLPSDFTTNNTTRGWLRTFSGEREKPGRERKGWMIIIHDLSGSPVAAASMITPFVPSPGSDRVSRSNPGAWLILRPHGYSVSSWKPWGRLEAWRERGPIYSLGYKFELVADTGLTSGIPIAEGTMNVKKGGQFCIDSRLQDSVLSSLSPVRGFVMSSTVVGEGKVSKPTVQVGVQHVTCMPDAALFVALSAAIDLSIDACRLFSHKLRKEFLHEQQESFS